MPSYTTSVTVKRISIVVKKFKTNNKSEEILEKRRKIIILQ